MKLAFGPTNLPKSGVLVVFATEGGKLTAPAAYVDKSCNGQITRAIKAANFEAKREQVLDVIAAGGFDRVLVVGLGKADSINAREVELMGGVIGVVPFNRFLSARWQPADGKEAVTLAAVLDMIDHICQVTGSAAHVGLGSDFDGGFGVENTPAEIDTVADLQKLDGLLKARGYADRDVAAILGQNWIEVLRRGLPA